jgi:hypothetical protein
MDATARTSIEQVVLRRSSRSSPGAKGNPEVADGYAGLLRLTRRPEQETDQDVAAFVYAATR